MGRTASVVLVGIFLNILTIFLPFKAVAEESEEIGPKEFVEKFNMRTIISSFTDKLNYYCESYPKDYFSVIWYVSDNEVRLYNGADQWKVRFDGDNHITLLAKVEDGSYHSEISSQLVHFKTTGEVRAGKIVIEKSKNCKPFILESQVSFGEGNYSFEKKVTYIENHDPGYIDIGNGEELQVSYDSIPWEEVDAWPSGKELSIVYDKNSGIRLKDPDTGRSLPVFYYSGESPVDQILDACTDVAVDTMSIAGCYEENLRAWDAELNRNYIALMSVLNDQEKSKVRAAQRQWIKYRDAQLEAVHQLSYRSGTLWIIRAAAIAAGITKDQAVLLGSLAN